MLEISMSSKRSSPMGMTSRASFSTPTFNSPSSTRKEEENNFTVDHLCDKVQSMKDRLTTAESSLKGYSLKKKELERLLENSTEEVNQLREKTAKMKGERDQRKLRDEMLTQDIKRLTEEIEAVKKEEEEILAKDKEEEAKVDKDVADFEKNSLYRARLLRLRIPGGKEDSMKDQAETFQKEIKDMEEEIERITLEKESRSLPFEEMKVLLEMATKANIMNMN